MVTPTICIVGMRTPGATGIREDTRRLLHCSTTGCLNAQHKRVGSGGRGTSELGADLDTIDRIA